MKSTTHRNLELVIKTLNYVSVNGKDNLNMLLGSIQTLEKILQDEEVEPEDVLDGD